MARKKIVAGNWKMNMTPSQAVKLVEELNSQEQEIVMLRYYKGKTQTEVAKKLGISQVQVSRIEKRALTKLLREFIKNKEGY